MRVLDGDTSTEKSVAGLTARHILQWAEATGRRRSIQ